MKGILIGIYLSWIAVSHGGETPLIPALLPQVSADRPALPAYEAFRDGRHHAAVEIARPLADRNHTDALFLLGFAMESTKPLRPTDLDAMAYYYRKAAAAGHPEAAFRGMLVALADKRKNQDATRTLESAAHAGEPLALRFTGEAWLRGLLGDKPDATKAAEYWERAAKGGDAASLLLLGRLHAGAFGFPEKTDMDAAIRFHRKAADQGVDDAMIPLASLLLGGGPSAHETEAREWLGKALRKGLIRAHLILGDHEEAVGKNPGEAMACYRRGAEAGQPDCLLRLAMAVIRTNKEEGFQWLEKAADGGSAVAAAELGVRLSETNLAEGHTYLMAAANEGIPRAQYHLGLLYLRKESGRYDPVAAQAWLSLAAKSGDPEMLYLLGTLHEAGQGCPMNYANAGVLYTTACRKGSGPAAGRIAFMAAEGLGTQPDPVQAWAHATLAVERGDGSTKDLLLRLDEKLSPAERQQGEAALAKIKAASPASPDGVGTISSDRK